MFEVTYEIPDSDVEKTYNHVHHATSLLYLEKARLNFLKSVGLPNDELIAKDIFLVLTRINVSYERELFAEKIRVTCDKMRVLGKFLSMSQSIFNERGKEAVVAEIGFACLSRKSGRAIPPPESFIQAFLSH